MHSNRLKETKYLHEQDIFKLKKENYANASSSSSTKHRNNKLLDKNEKVASNFNAIVRYDGDDINNDDEDDDDDDDQDCAEIEE